MPKPFSPACERNQDVILEVLRRQFSNCTRVLEIGSGTGQHAVHFARALAGLVWQTSDVSERLSGIRQWLNEARLANTPPPLAFDINSAPLPMRFDGIFSANTLHIMSWEEVERLFSLLPEIMSPGATLVIYGPFKHAGTFSTASNAAFDASLRVDHPHRGIRDFEAVDSLAREIGLQMIEDRDMPANNRCVTWRQVA
jgi:SAM-dependent methyltransferase